MGLSRKAIEEFKNIYREEFKEEISDTEAQELAESLLSLFKVIYRPTPQDPSRSQEDKLERNST